MKLEQAVKRVGTLDSAVMEQAQRRWDRIAKPLGSLGKLEQLIVRIAGICRTVQLPLQQRGVLIFCADNGVVEEGVTQTGSDVTAVVAENFLSGETSVCRMAEVAHADILPVDIGMNRDVSGMVSLKSSYGTKNITKGPAMTRIQAQQAVEAGVELVRDCKKRGYGILATGEMGIGNTTTSSAVASVLLCQPVRAVTGRGAGLSDAGLEKKRAAIEKAIAMNRPDPDDVMDVLSKVGGFDLAGLTGAFIGGGIYRIPMIVDGLISAVAALCAVRLCPAVDSFLIPSHLSEEPAARLVFDALKLDPVLYAGMHLGEGTGAVTLFPLLDMAYAVYHQMSTFEEIEVEAYQHYGEETV